MDIKHSAPAKPRSFLQGECKQGQVYKLVQPDGIAGSYPRYLLCVRINSGWSGIRMINLSTGNRQSDAENPPECYVPVNAVLHVEA